MSALLAIDPGTYESGWVILTNGRVTASGVCSNQHLLDTIAGEIKPMIIHHVVEDCAIEMIASYGMAVGHEVFETCVWIGRFSEAWRRRYGSLPTKVFRKDVKLHLCGSPRAKDPNVRQALLDRLGPQGTKAAPGPTYGVKSHAWAALAVAVTHQDRAR
ncbi:hypothetical protein [Arenimonas sp.]|uniref:hypothetical protein n=1 Tax=Arenimonas sp. TaxID=1872635 RepID=UPI0039E3D9EE